MANIDRKNLASAKMIHDYEKTKLASEKNSLIQTLHDCEIHQLANKYKLDTIADDVCYT